MSKNVYLGMVGDILHPGLINIINEGAKLGELTIGLYTDKAIATYRSRLPYMTYEQREQVIKNIRGVAHVVPQDEYSYIPNLQKYRPDILIHGDNWKEGRDSELRLECIKVMADLGGEVVEVPYTKGINSSSLFDEVKAIGTTPDIRLKSLRRLIAAKPIVRILEAHDGLSALIIERYEVKKGQEIRAFDGMWSSSLTDSTSKGKPDIEAVDLTTRMQDLTNILECTTKPIIYDGDTGGLPEHFQFTVRTLERNGVSAIIIEDKTGLKKNSLFGTEVEQTQASIPDFCAKISAGKRAQRTKDFMICARIESLILERGMEDALNRAFAFTEAGADAIMIHSRKKDPAEIFEFVEKFRAKDSTTPIVVVPTSFNTVTEEEFKARGVNVVIYANQLTRTAFPAMQNAAELILKNHRAKECDDICMPFKDIIRLIPDGE